MFFPSPHFLNQWSIQAVSFLKTVFFPTSCSIETLLPKVTKELSKRSMTSFRSSLFLCIIGVSLAPPRHLWQCTTPVSLFLCLLPCPLGQLSSFYYFLNTGIYQDSVPRASAFRFIFLPLLISLRFILKMYPKSISLYTTTLTPKCLLDVSFLRVFIVS